jgi:hypothetical protein
MRTSGLPARASAWMAELHPHYRHMERTLWWVDRLDPGASEALRIAAITHDCERAYPDRDAGWDSAVSWDDPEYGRWHQERCARIVAGWLRDKGAEVELVDEVERLVRVHEDGGWPEADLLQAADSLSFLETLGGLLSEWVQSGRASRERAMGKARHSAERIAAALTVAREEAGPLLAAVLQRLAAVPVPEEVLAATALVRRGRIFSLARDRFPGMPLFPGHPAFEVLSYRTPQGIRAAGDRPWGARNDAGLGYMSELVMSTTHSGAHIDAHAHMTVGPDDRWNSGSAARHRVGSPRNESGQGLRGRHDTRAQPLGAAVAHATGTRGCGIGRSRADQSGDRPPAGDLRPDRRDPPDERVREAGDPPAGGARCSAPRQP